jgi:ATP-dependent RNA helicase RhlE
LTIQFDSLALAAPLLRALTEEGYTTPTPIQAQAIPEVLAGRDLLGCAQTGTGKTAAFALPVLHRLMTGAVDKTRRGPAVARALVLSPTRELATQIADSFQAYGRHSGLGGACIFGGVGQHRQVKSLQRGVDIIVATPGRLLDLMEQGHVDLSAVEVLVLDEADRMLDMGFIQPIREIAAETPATRQTLLFSATMPKEIVRLAESLLRNPVRVSVTPVASAAPLIEQSVYMVSRHTKQALLEHTLEEGKIARALVFTRTKHGADRVTQRLMRAGISALAIHGNKAQNQRERALEAFRSGRSRVLVATDVAARGIDVDGVTHVFNFDLPNEPEAYVHRIGRTGRAGAKGIAISFCDSDERGFLRSIERLTGKPMAAITTLPAMAPSAHEPEPGESHERRGAGVVSASSHHAKRAEPARHAPNKHAPAPAPSPSHAARPHAPSGGHGTRERRFGEVVGGASAAPRTGGGHRAGSGRGGVANTAPKGKPGGPDHSAGGAGAGPRRPGKSGQKRGYPRG